ncbi:MAG: hypothetical protein V4457_11770 [Pseudomonadota bacterium]
MILENLRDRHPEMFYREPPRHRRRTLVDVIQPEPPHHKGDGKARIWNARLQHYLTALRALVNRPETLANIAATKDRADRLAQTGGFEASK